MGLKKTLEKNCRKYFQKKSHIKFIQPLKTGAGGARCLHSKASDCGNWCQTGAGNLKSGAGIAR
jgi:hypothetical protein